MPAVFVHGSASSGRMWRPYLPLVDEAVVLDLPGALGASVDLSDWSLETDIAAVEAAVLGLDGPVDLVAHSYGGLLALRVALRHSDRVRQVVAHEPVCWSVLMRLVPEEGLALFGGQAVVDGFLKAADVGSEAWMERFVDFWHVPGAWQHLPPPLRAAFVAGGPKTYAEVAAIFEEPTPLDAWREMAVPVRVTVGARTPAPQKLALDVWMPLVGAEVVPVAGGHLATTTHVGDLAPVFGAWLRG